MKQNFIILSIILSFLTACNKKKTNSTVAKNYFQQSLMAVEKNKREALALIDQSIDAEPTPRAYALKATLLYQTGNYQESLALFEKLMHDKSTPVHLKTDVSNNYACNLLAVGKIEKAKKIWLDLTTNRYYLSPEVAWFNLGLLELASVPERPQPLPEAEQKQLEKAEMYFRKAVKINQDYLDGYFYLSITLIRLNKLDEAKQELINVIGIMPEHQNAQNLLITIDKFRQQAYMN